MAAGNFSDLIDVESLKQQQEQVLGLLSEIQGKLRGVASDFKGIWEDTKGATSLKEITEAQKKLTKAKEDEVALNKEYRRVQEDAIKLDVRINAAKNENQKIMEANAKTTAKQRVELAELNRENKRQAEAQQAAAKLGKEYTEALKEQGKSINALTEQNKQLRAVRDALDTTTQAEKIRELNATIDANTAIIKSNQDAYVQQKMNIGNYRSAIEGLEGELKASMALLQQMAAQGDTQSQAYKDVEKSIADTTQQIGDFKQKMLEAVKDVEPMRTQLKALRNEAQVLYAAMQDGSATEDMISRFHKVTAEAAEMQDTIEDTNSIIKNMASDTATFEAIVQGLQVATAGAQVFQGAMAASGYESEEFKEVLQKLQGVQAMANGLLTISNALQKESALMTSLTTAATSKSTTVRWLAVTAQKALNAAQKAMPYAALALGIAAIGVALAKYAINASGAGREQKILNDLQKESTEAAKKDVGELTKLIATAKLYGEGSRERADAIRKINEQYGDYLPQMLSEKATIEEITVAYEALLPVLQKQAVVRAAMEQLSKQSEERVKLAQEEVKAEEDLRKAKEKTYTATYGEDYVVTAEVAKRDAIAAADNRLQKVRANNAKEYEKIAANEQVIMGAAQKAIAGLGDAKKNDASDTKDQAAATDELAKLTQKLQEVQLSAMKNEEERAKKQLRLSYETAQQGYEAQKTALSKTEDDRTKNAARLAKLDEIMAANRVKYAHDSAAMEVKFAQQAAASAISTRIMLAKQGSGEELQARRDLINQTLEYELSLLPKNSAKREELEVKAMNEIEALEKAHAERKRNIELENVGIRLEYAEKGSLEELGLITYQLELQRQAEVAAADKSGADVAAINEKWKKKIAEDTGKWALASMDDASRKQVDKLTEQSNTELTILNNRYKNGELNFVQYERAKLEHAKKYATQGLDMQLAALDKLIAANKLAPEQQVEAEQKAADLRRQISDKLADDKLATEQALTDKIVELTQAVVGFASGLFNGMYENRIAGLEKQKEELQKSHDDEMELIESAGYTQEQEEAEKRSQIAETRAAEKKIENEIKEEKKKQAIANKAAAIAQIAISTAMAVMNIWATVPKFDFGISTGVLSAAAIALGAIQAAAVATQPIPEYEKGRDGGPAEWAIVGEKRREVILGKDGVARVTPDHPTLTYLNPGESVIPSMEEYVRMTAKPEYTATPTVVNVDLTAMVEEQKRQGRATREAIKNQSEVAWKESYGFFEAAKKEGFSKRPIVSAFNRI